MTASRSPSTTASATTSSSLLDPDAGRRRLPSLAAAACATATAASAPTACSSARRDRRAHDARMVLLQRRRQPGRDERQRHPLPRPGRSPLGRGDLGPHARSPPTPGRGASSCRQTDDPAPSLATRRHGRGHRSRRARPAGATLGADPRRPVAHLDLGNPHPVVARRRRRRPSTSPRSAPRCRGVNVEFIAPGPERRRHHDAGPRARRRRHRGVRHRGVRRRLRRPPRGAWSTPATGNSWCTWPAGERDAWRSDRPTSPRRVTLTGPGPTLRRPTIERRRVTSEQPVQRGARRHPHRAHLPGAHRPRRRHRSPAAPTTRPSASLDELAAAGRHRRRRRGRPASSSAATIPTPRGYIGKGKAEELRELCLDGRRRHRRLRRRADARPSSATSRSCSAAPPSTAPR